MNDKYFPLRFTEVLRPGAYLRIVVEATLARGDEVRVTDRPDRDLTIRDVFRIYSRDRHEAERLLSIGDRLTERRP